MRPIWMIRFALLLLAAGAGLAGARAASYAKPDSGEQLFSGPVRLRIEIPKDGMKVLREYVQVWRQTRPERIDVRATVHEGGRIYTNVAVHLKGSYSFQPIDEKPSLTLNFNKFAPGQKFHGQTKIHLNNSAQDPSYLSEPFARELFRSLGVPTPRAGHARVSLNGRDLGLCVLIEGANREWVKRNFASAKGNLYDGGSGGEITRALEADSGENRNDRSDLTNLVKAVREPDLKKRLTRLSELIDLEQFITFAATEAFLVHWDGYALGANNYRLFHDTARGKMVFIPGGMDQLFLGTTARQNITPAFKGLVAKSLFVIPEARQRYLQRIESLLANELSVDVLHARVDLLAAPLIAGLKDDPGLRQEVEQGARSLKARITARSRNVAQQLKTPVRPVQLAAGGELLVAPWTFKAGTTLTASASRTVQDNRQMLRVSGRGESSTGAWRSTVLLGTGRYEFTGLARTEGIAARPGETNGVLLRISGEREVEGITVSDSWVRLRYEFEVEGIQDVELIGEFRGAQGMGMFDAGTLRLKRLVPPK